MTTITELWTNRENYRQTRVVSRGAPDLAEGEVLMKIEKFGLTSNNVSYAVSGDVIGYWGFYPAEDNWGKVPVWGFAEVIESRNAEVNVGERVWGFLPMASHVIMQPGKVSDRQWFDAAPHRRKLPALYNNYLRTAVEPEILKRFEDERCILFPLFATSYILYDFLLDNDFFGADQVLIGSASSKTGFGLAYLLHSDQRLSKSVVALTSEGNADFCSALGCFSDVVLYGNEDQLDPAVKSVFVDMSGDSPMTLRLHHHFEDSMVSSWKVGLTHWEAGGKLPKDLPGTRPTFFFAPAHIAKRDEEWGPGKFWERAFTASIGVTQATASNLDIVARNGAEQAASSWNDLLENKLPGSTGLIISF